MDFGYWPKSYWTDYWHQKYWQVWDVLYTPSNLIYSCGVPNLLSSCDSVMLTGFAEFAYNTSVVPHVLNPTQGWNDIQDRLIDNKPQVERKADFVRMVEEDLLKLTWLKTCVLWVNWYTWYGNDTNANVLVVGPAVSESIYTDMQNTSNFISGGLTTNQLTIIPSWTKLTGSEDDNGLVSAAIYLKSLGYKLGLCPVALFMEILSSTFTFLWRGMVVVKGSSGDPSIGVGVWDNISQFTAWCNSYESFVKFYIDLMVNNGITLDIIYLGTECRGFTVVNEMSDIWIDTLFRLAEYSKLHSPNTITTYAANWDEYMMNEFIADRLWTHPYIDKIGVDWYPSVMKNHTNNIATMKNGVTSGEGWDSYMQGWNMAQQVLSTSNKRGKLDESFVTQGEQYGLKNLGRWKNYYHYKTKSTNLLGVTPLPGYSSGNTYSLSALVSNNGLITNIPAVGSGMQLSANIKDTYIKFENGVIYGTLPTSSGKYNFSNQKKYEIELILRIDTVNTTYPRIIRINNIFELQILTTDSPWTLQTVVYHSGGTSYGYPHIEFPIGEDFKLRILADILAGTVELWINDVSKGVVNTLTGGTINSWIDSEAFSLGGYNQWSSWELSGKLFYFKMSSEISTLLLPIGGEFYFDDDYAGVRTAWIPNLKPTICTEFGATSVHGSAVTPNVFSQMIEGSGELPEWPDKWFFQYFKDNYANFIPEDFYIPYGSNGKFDQIHQALYLDAISTHLKTTLGWVDSITVYNVDARPSRSFLATDTNGLYYIDGPTQLYTNNITGKLAGNSDMTWLKDYGN